jgi:hypothetical protein
MDPPEVTHSREGPSTTGTLTRMSNRRIISVASIALVLIAGCGTKNETATDVATTTVDPVTTTTVAPTTTTTDPMPADKAAIKQYYRDMRQAMLKGERSSIEFALLHAWPIGEWTQESLTCETRKREEQRLGRPITVDEYIQAVDQNGPPWEITIDEDSVDVDPGFTSLSSGPGAGQPIPGRIYVVKVTRSGASGSPVTAEVHVSILPDGNVVNFPVPCD